MGIENLIQNLLQFKWLQQRRSNEWIKSHRNYTMCHVENEIILIGTSHGNVLMNVHVIYVFGEMKSSSSQNFEFRLSGKNQRDASHNEQMCIWILPSQSHQK